MKKLTAIIVILALLMAAIPFAAASADDVGGEVTVTIDGTPYTASKGMVIDYFYYLNINDKITSLDGILSYSSDGLKLTVDLDEYDEEYEAYAAIFPVIRDIVVVNYDEPGELVYNVSRPAGTKSFNKDTSVLMQARFTVTASTGSFEINNSITALEGMDKHIYIFDGEVLDAPTVSRSAANIYDPNAPTEMPTERPTEKPTEKPTENPSENPSEIKPTEKPTGTVTDPTVVPTADVTVKADGVSYRLHIGDTFEYIFYLNTGEKLCSIDGDFTYSASGLEPLYDEDEEYEDDAERAAGLFPIIGGALVVSEPVPGGFIYNYSHPKGKSFNKNSSELIRATFKVIGTPGGEYEIVNNVHTVAGADQFKYLYLDEELAPLKYMGSEIVGGERLSPAPTMPPTEPHTQAPTTAPITDPTSGPVVGPTAAPTTAPTAPSQGGSDSNWVIIKADGKLYRAYTGEIIDYVYYLNVGGKLCSLQAELFYDPAGLELLYEEDMEDIFTLTVTSNEISPGDIKYNYSHTKGKTFNKNESVLISAQFRVTATSGTYEINNILQTIAGSNEFVFMKDCEVINPLDYHGSELLDKDIYDPGSPEPDPVLLVDETTGIMAETALADEIKVEIIKAIDLNYYLGKANDYKIYVISLYKDGKELELTEPVKLMIPADEDGALYNFTHTTSTDLTVIDLDAKNRNGYCQLNTDRMGMYILSLRGAQPEIALYGDVDRDNEVSILDATFIQRDLAGLEKFTKQQENIAQVDTDGELTILDATHIQRWLAGLSSDLERFGYPKA